MKGNQFHAVFELPVLRPRRDGAAWWNLGCAKGTFPGSLNLQSWSIYGAERSFVNFTFTKAKFSRAARDAPRWRPLSASDTDLAARIACLEKRMNIPSQTTTTATPVRPKCYSIIFDNWNSWGSDPDLFHFGVCLCRPSSA